MKLHKLKSLEGTQNFKSLVPLQKLRCKSIPKIGRMKNFLIIHEFNYCSM